MTVEILFGPPPRAVWPDVTKAQRRVVGHAQPDLPLAGPITSSFLKTLKQNQPTLRFSKYDVLNVTCMVFSILRTCQPSTLPWSAEQDTTEAWQVRRSSAVIILDASFLKVDNVSLVHPAKDRYWSYKTYDSHWADLTSNTDNTRCRPWIELWAALNLEETSRRLSQDKEYQFWHQCHFRNK